MAKPDKTPSTERLKTLWTQWRERIRRTVPPGLRSVLGLVLVAGGILGFLPVLGFWMIPLGIAVIAMDVKPLIAAIRRKPPGK